MVQRQISKEQLKVIMKLTQKGETRPQIAKEAECSKRSVYLWQKKLELI